MPLCGILLRLEGSARAHHPRAPSLDQGTITANEGWPRLLRGPPIGPKRVCSVNCRPTRTGRGGTATLTVTVVIAGVVPNLQPRIEFASSTARPVYGVGVSWKLDELVKITRKVRSMRERTRTSKELPSEARGDATELSLRRASLQCSGGRKAIPTPGIGIPPFELFTP